MTSEKLVCLFVLLLRFFKGNSFLNSTQTEVPEAVLSKIPLENQTLLAGGLHLGTFGSNSTITLTAPEQTSPSEFSTIGINSNNASKSELIEIFHGVTESGTDEVSLHGIMITDCVNVSSVNTTCTEPSWNDTAKTNYTLMAEAAEAFNPEMSGLRLEKSVAIAAGVFLVSAVIGYLSCVGYRRFLQRKYGNSQILVAEEVYDTSDLRYFEI